MHSNNNNHYGYNTYYKANQPSNSYQYQNSSIDKTNPNLNDTKQHSSSTLLPYHEYIAIKKKNSQQDAQQSQSQINNPPVYQNSPRKDLQSENFNSYYQQKPYQYQHQY